MTLKAFKTYFKLHAKTIGLIIVIGLILILHISSATKSKTIAQLLLKIKQTKLTNDIAIIQHTISVNNASISGLDKNNAQATATISAVESANAIAQSKLKDRALSLSDLAKQYQQLN